LKKPSAGGIEGKMILSYSEALKYCSNNDGEIKGALIGLRYSSNLGLKNLKLEMDSKVIVDMIKGSMEV